MLYMERININCVVSDGAIVPEYKTLGAAGADVYAFLKEPVIIAVGKSCIIPTGVFYEIPEGFEIQVRPRSGLAAKNGVTVLYTPGTIDSDYRGELQVILINLGNEDFVVRNGDRIAQIIVAPVIQGNFVQVKNLSVTERGQKGFGSTGV